MTRITLLALLAFAIILSGCERTSELIPGGAQSDNTSSATAIPTAIAIPSTVGTGTTSGTPTPSLTDHELARSVVQIQAIDATKAIARTVRDGSGVIVDHKAGLILTSYDIVNPYLSTGEDAYSMIGIGINIGDGNEPKLEYLAQLIAVDIELNFAILRITQDYQGMAFSSETLSSQRTALGTANTVNIGDKLRLFGHPGLKKPSAQSQALTVTSSSLKAAQGAYNYENATILLADAQLSYGSNGGPVFDRLGTLIGILTSRNYDVSKYVSQIRPINLAFELIEGAQNLTTDFKFSAPLYASEPAAGFDSPITNDGVSVSKPLFAEHSHDHSHDHSSANPLMDYKFVFDSGTTELHFEFLVQGVPPGAIIEERWFLDGVLQDSLSSSYPWSGSNSSLISDRITVPSTNGLPDGRWRLEIWVDEAMRSTRTAIVGRNSDQPTMFDPEFGSLANDIGQSAMAPSVSAEQILLFLRYTGMGSADMVRWDVYHEGTLAYESPKLQWPGTDAGKFWIGYSTPNSVGAGRWVFEIFVNDVLTLEAAWEGT